MYVKSGSPKSLSNLDSTFEWKAPGSQIDLRDMVQELQGIRVSSVKISGDTASALLRVRSAGGVSADSSDITTDDVIFGAVEFQSSSTRYSGIEWVSLRNDIRISATTGYISISNRAANTGPGSSYILLFWLDKSGYAAY